jgi:O-antigen/teichoic acid export membrane protein
MLKQFVFSFLLRVSIPAFGVVNFMLLVRLFSEDEVGVWVLYMTILALIEVAKSGFIKNATVWLLNKSDESQHRAILSSSLVVNLLATGLIMLIVLASSILLNLFTGQQLLSNLLLIYLIQLFVYVFFSHYDYILTSKVKFKPMMFAYLLRNGVFFVGLSVVYVFYRNEIELNDLVFLQILGMALSVTLLRFFTKESFRIKNVQRSHIFKILNYGKYVFATNASSMLFRSTDHYMIAAMLNNASVAYYNVALRITNLVDLPSTAAAEVLFPMSVKESNNLEQLKKLYEKTVGYIVAIIFPVTAIIFLFAEPITVFIAGEDYLVSVPILQITLIYGLLLPHIKQFGTIINALDKAKLNTYLMFSTFLVNIFFNYIFIKYFGLRGAAYGTMVSYILSLGASQVILSKLLKINMMNTFSYSLLAYKDIFNRLKLFLIKR